MDVTCLWLVSFAISTFIFFLLCGRTCDTVFWFVFVLCTRPLREEYENTTTKAGRLFCHHFLVLVAVAVVHVVVAAAVGTAAVVATVVVAAAAVVVAADAIAAAVAIAVVVASAVDVVLVALSLLAATVLIVHSVACPMILRRTAT